VRIPRDALEGAGFKEGQDLDLVTRDGILQLKSAESRFDLAEMVEEMKRIPAEDRPGYEDWGIVGAEWPIEDWSDIAPTNEAWGSCMAPPESIPDAGDIVWMDFGPPFGHEQAGRRPGVVMTPSAYNEFSSMMMVCPITRNAKPWPDKVAVSASDVVGFVLVDQMRAIDRTTRWFEISGRVPDEVLSEVRGKLRALLFP
jgi:mRNA interferase MazF